MSRRHTASLALLSLLFTPAGLCAPGGDDGPDEGISGCLVTELPPQDQQATVIIGTGEGSDFVALTSGATLEMFEGAQGGAHVNVSVRAFAAGLDPDIQYAIQMSYSAGGSGYIELLQHCDGHWQESPTQRMFLDSVAPSSGTLTVSILEGLHDSVVLATAEVDIVVE